jgi:hypothetical protein
MALAGCGSSSEEKTGQLLVCNPSVTERCVPVRWDELEPGAVADLRTPTETREQDLRRAPAAGKGKGLRTPPGTRAATLRRATPAPTVDRTAPPAIEPAAPATEQAPPVIELGAPTSTTPAGLKTFAGRYFAVHYPRGWRVETAEVSLGAYLDTTIRSVRDPATYLRVDVTPAGRASGAADHARRVEAYLRPQPGYERLGFSRVTLGGAEAIRWDFTVRESGVLLRKVDVFLADGEGNVIAILTQAPAGVFPQWERLFDRLRGSLAPRAAP